MLIEKVSKKEDRFWTGHLIFTVLLMVILYSLNHSAALLQWVMPRAAGRADVSGMTAGTVKLMRAVLRFGPDFLWGFGIVTAVSYIFRRTKEQLRNGMLIVTGFEALLFLIGILAFAKGSMEPGTYLSVAAGNGLALLIVMIHERMLV